MLALGIFVCGFDLFNWFGLGDVVLGLGFGYRVRLDGFYICGCLLGRWCRVFVLRVIFGSKLQFCDLIRLRLRTCIALCFVCVECLGFGMCVLLTCGFTLCFRGLGWESWF